MNWTPCLVFAALAVAAATAVPHDRDTLVLLDNLAIKETHSIFFKSLQGLYTINHVVVFRVLDQ